MKKIDGAIIIIVIIILVILGFAQSAASRSGDSSKDTNVPTTQEAPKDKDPEPEPAGVNPGDIVLSPNQDTNVDGLNIKLNKVRPESSTSIIAELTLSEGGKFKNITYSSSNAPIEYHGYKVSINGILPKPEQGKEVKQSDYMLSFKVEKPNS